MMHKLRMIIFSVYIFCIYSPVLAASCPQHTDEQALALHNAYHTGVPYDLGYTLAAIVIQESFVGKHIIRVNSKDGKYGSYGITHIKLETAMWLESVDSSWEARAVIVPQLVIDDDYSLQLSIKKLRSTKRATWWGLWKSYNGKGPAAKIYAGKIRRHIEILRTCYRFDRDF